MIHSDHIPATIDTRWDFCGNLAPGATIEAEVLAVAYTGITGVQRIEPDGVVVGANL